MDLYVYGSIYFNIMDIIPLEIPIGDQVKVISLQIMLWVIKICIE
jgi:hypothetical protein